MIMALSIVLLAVCSATAQPHLPGKKRARPDFKVTDVQVTNTTDGAFIEKISITINNGCQVDAPNSYVMATFKTADGPNGQALYYIGNTVLALKGGSSGSQTFDVKDKKLRPTLFILVEVDPYRKIVEGDENNNWRKLNPNSAPFPAANPCEPK
jgi:hypothetical protein